MPLIAKYTLMWQQFYIVFNLIWILFESIYLKMTSESLVSLPCSSGTWTNEDEECGDEEVEERIIENTQDTVSKKRRKGKEYHFFASFETLKLAEDSLKEERLWSKVGMRKKHS